MEYYFKVVLDHQKGKYLFECSEGTADQQLQMGKYISGRFTVIHEEVAQAVNRVLKNASTEGEKSTLIASGVETFAQGWFSGRKNLRDSRQ